MKHIKQSLQLLDNLTLPEQTLSKLSCNNSDKIKKFTQWCDDLKTTQAIGTSIELYQVLPEINQLKADYATRCGMLESVRDILHTVSAGLAKTYLKKPIILPAEAQKAAIIAQAIQKHLCDGYLICLKQYLSQEKKPQLQEPEKAALLIYRAMHAIQTLFFRSYQLYTRYPHGLWLSLHTLYKIGDMNDLLSHPIEDNYLTQQASMTVEHIYGRTLLLSSARPNQLSQLDTTSLYDALENWCSKIHITSTRPTNALLGVDLSKDSGPIYLDETTNQNTVFLDTKAMAKYLSDNTDQQMTVKHNKSVAVSGFIIRHALTAWTEKAQRLDQRNNTGGDADICIGLLDCHQLLTKGESFQQFVENDLSQNIQHSNGSFTPNRQFDSALPDNVPISECKIVNTSQHGFCLLWQGEIPTKIVAGEILLIRERSRSKWKLGAIRWIKQLKGASQLGVQIIAHDPVPAAIKQSTYSGKEIEFQRALLTSNQNDDNTLLCPANIFNINNKAEVIQNGQQKEIKIERSVYMTSNVAQYAYNGQTQ